MLRFFILRSSNQVLAVERSSISIRINKESYEHQNGKIVANKKMKENKTGAVAGARLEDGGVFTAEVRNSWG